MSLPLLQNMIEVPSLKVLAANALKSFQSREIMKDVNGVIDCTIINYIDEVEKAHLDAIGKIPDDSMQNYYSPMTKFIQDQQQLRSSKPRNLKRKFQEIDGARLESYNDEDDSFKIRIDDTERPAFWCQVTVPLKSLQVWLFDQGIEMTYKKIDENV